MARGSEAKEKICRKIQECFNEDFIGVFDKKLYLWSEENGENIQVALSLTCPKTPISTERMSTNVSSNEPEEKSAFPEPQANEISEAEKNTIAELMEKLGL